MSQRNLRSGDGFEPLRPPFDLWRPPAGAHQQLVFLTSKPEEFMSHWTGRHSIPCIEPIEECQGHMDGLPERWRAYAMVLLQPTEQKVFWELPKETFNSIMAFVGKGNCWRGHRVLVIRGMGEKAHMRLEFQAAWDLTTKRPLPGATSVTETLNVLYDLQERKRKKQS